MFGYLIASANYLTPDELERYKNCYCGLCRTLKTNYGEISRLTLNYDMTFLILLLQSLYELPEANCRFKCFVHPGKEKNEWHNEITEYAADMLIALSYYKLIDDWNDESSLASFLASVPLKRCKEISREKYPVQIATIEQGIADLNLIEKSNIDNLDAAASCFGHIMGEIFVFKDDRWKDTLYNLGNSLGRFIYLMDAVMDIDKDTRINSYNPFRKYYGLDNSERFRDILKVYLADAIVEFEKLPLITDVGLMKNILCTGLWSAFEEKYGSIQSSGHKSKCKR